MIVNSCLNDVIEPEKFLRSLSKVVEYEGTLVISSDYNWERNTNQVCPTPTLQTNLSNILIRFKLGLF